MQVQSSRQIRHTCPLKTSCSHKFDQPRRWLTATFTLDPQHIYIQQYQRHSDTAPVGEEAPKELPWEEQGRSLPNSKLTTCESSDIWRLAVARHWY